jgi:pyruvate/2-oxoglutarate dehydrogenase complex dihydrolipoamide acyltransferase (E2) component
MPDITMPKMGFDMQEGTIVRWLKKPGDEVRRGEPIAEIETDKVTIEIEAFESGTLTEIVVQEGQSAPVNAVIARLDGGNGSQAPVPVAAAPAVSPACRRCRLRLRRFPKHRRLRQSLRRTLVTSAHPRWRVGWRVSTASTFARCAAVVRQGES